jgi:L-fuculose-phosphate aldolase
MHTFRSDIVRVARRLDDKGILTSTDGNLSVLLDDGRLLITPSGCCKGLVDAEDLVVVDADGSVEGEGRPSLEIALHRMIYAMRPDARAVIHAHPPYATAYAVAGISLDRPILSEVVLALGEVPVAPYATPTRGDLAETIVPFVHTHDAILLRHHGAVVFAPDIARAGFLMETLEHVAQIDFLTRSLGSSAVLGDDAIETLRKIRESLRASL